jgi:hypothetical protein
MRRSLRLIRGDYPARDTPTMGPHKIFERLLAQFGGPSTPLLNMPKVSSGR